MFLAIRLVLKLGSFLAGLWILASAVLFGLMWLPPAEFSLAMKYAPMAAARVLPFQSMWGVARGGSLDVGDLAPDFDLRRQDKSGRVKLSNFHGSRPVVLVFGSYT